MSLKNITTISHLDVPRPSYQFNELDERLVGIPAVNPFFRSDTGPRAAMFNKHMSQRPTLIEPTTQRLQTGVGYELGKYTYQIVIPENSYISAVIPKYNNTISNELAKKNPLETVIYVDDATQTIDYVDLVKYHSQHQYFGFEYKYNQSAIEQVRKDARIHVDTVIADSPSKSPDGDYKFGIHANIALMTDPVVIEDGIKMSESFAHRMRFTLIESRTIVINNNVIGLNLYGDDKSHQMFPNIGELIRKDGILFSAREYTNDLAPCELSLKALRQPTIFDVSTFGEGGAEVIDIEIIKGDVQRADLMEDMQTQLDKHHSAQIRYRRAIYDEYRRLMKETRNTLKLSHRFSNLVKDSYAILNSDDIKLSYRSKSKMNGWTVKITYKYTLTPKIGYKATNLHGGKGVICEVVPDDQMPINEINIRADIVMDASSFVNRTIMGAPTEIYINAALDKLLWDIRHMVVPEDKSTYETAFNHVLGFYKIVCPRMYDLILSNDFNAVKHVDELLKNNVGLQLDASSPVDYIEVIELLREHFPAVYGKVKYTGTDGNLKTSKSDILIGGCYMILLDKIATESAAVASAKTQHFGIPSKLNKLNKYHSPARDQPTKTIAEDESRVLESIVGGEMTADLIDQTNNPDVHKTILRNIYTSDKPSNIYRLVDRKLNPTGHGYIQNMVANVMNCAGVEFTTSRGDITK